MENFDDSTEEIFVNFQLTRSNSMTCGLHTGQAIAGRIIRLCIFDNNKENNPIHFQLQR